MRDYKYLSSIFTDNQPFPHIVIDNFFPPELEQELWDAVKEWPEEDWMGWSKFDNNKEKKLACGTRAAIPKKLLEVINGLNADEFVQNLQDLTGTRGLEADHSLIGGGLHCIPRGGHLGIHEDFNMANYGGRKMQRKINVLLFLNDGWRDSYGGHLELWDKTMRKCHYKILPKWNRLVIFDTSKNSNHGHPHPLKCPSDMNRRSIATYYYAPPSHKTLQPHSTLFKDIPPFYHYEDTHSI